MQGGKSKAESQPGLLDSWAVMRRTDRDSVAWGMPASAFSNASAVGVQLEDLQRTLEEEDH